MDFGERLKAKVGPLPVWAWGLLAGGAFTIWYWVSQRNAGTSTDSGVVDDETGTVAPPSGDFGTVPIVPNDDPVQDENTNQEWLVQALNAAGTAGVSFVTAQIALQKYLNGQTLTTTQRGIVNKIIGIVGPPPEGTQGIPEVVPDKPTPKPPTKPTTSYDTVTTVTGATTRRFGQSLVIYVKTRWRSSTGHVGNPVGAVSVVVDNVTRALRMPLVNGNAVYVITPFKGMDSTKDKRWIIYAKYAPTAGSKAKSSDSSPLVVTIR